MSDEASDLRELLFRATTENIALSQENAALKEELKMSRGAKIKQCAKCKQEFLTWFAVCDFCLTESVLSQTSMEPQ